MEKKTSINENAPAIKDGNFEQINLNLADFSSTNFHLKDSFAKIINSRLQNVIEDALLYNSRLLKAFL